MATMFAPRGHQFYDVANRREMILIDDPASGWNGWLCYRHPDRQWVTLRKATAEDLASIELARATANVS